jgi:hypothetical protein
MILAIASRSYSKNPTISTALMQSVLDTLLLSMTSNTTPLYKIQALLLLLTWPFPKLEVMFPLSGFLMHVAMQNGLHIAMSSHEFARMKRNNFTDVDIQRRSEIWALCIIKYQQYVVDAAVLRG